ncbi:hypothetical protein [Chelativorans sp.]|uniref:hypothetical protein n=1 Tax=Chelativorans sp. TaxID=2203393 RepID=UPI0028112D6B|nr:hypothetical protein [Chelativorans sp.]
MKRFSSALLEELHAAVRRALARDGVVNVPAIAWEMKARFPEERASVTDLEAEVMAAGMAHSAAMFFHRPVPLAQQKPHHYTGSGATLH